MTLLLKLIREPVIWFILLGVLLYGAMALFRPAEAGDSIIIRPEAIRAAIRNDEDLTGVNVTPERRAALIQGLIDDEVLLREAYALGYDKNDPRVRRRLLGIMRSAMTQAVPEPSVTQLDKYYRENLDQFRTAESITFEQVFYEFTSTFPADREALQRYLDKLSPDERPGDFSALGRQFRRYARDRIVLYFGAEFADAVLILEPGAWHGPYTSRQGRHFVRILERHPSGQQTFEQVEPYLKQQWMFDEQRRQQQENIDALREKYEIIIPD